MITVKRISNLYLETFEASLNKGYEWCLTTAHSGKYKLQYDTVIKDVGRP